MGENITAILLVFEYIREEKPKEPVVERKADDAPIPDSAPASERHNRFTGGAGMVNGGYCLERTGCWSQSVTEVTLTIPLDSIFPSSDIDTKLLRIVFTTHSIRIVYGTEQTDSEVLVMPIDGGTIVPSESTWYFLNKDEKTEQCGDDIIYLIVVLCKQPPDGGKTYPGCEWWTHVFEMDEKIDTLTCSIGTDISTLPRHAVERAQREHLRFMSLTEDEKAAELAGIKDLKEVNRSFLLLIVNDGYIPRN